MLTFIIEPARSIPVSHECDIIVAGGGTAGVACAVCAARLGLRAVMIEQTAQPGGMVTGVTAWTGDRDNKGGFVREFFSWMENHGLYRTPYYNGPALVPYFDRLLEAHGVTPLYLTKVCNVIQDGPRVRGIIVESKQGRHAILAPLVIDATGDGDVAALAGADFQLGRPEDGAMQSMTLNMRVQNFHYDRLNLKEELLPEIHKVNPNYEITYDHGSLQHLPGTSGTTIIGGHVHDYDPLNAESLSRAMSAMRIQAEDFLNVLKQTPQGKEWECDTFSPLPGVRESRRICCDATVTDEDIFSGATYPDGIFTVAHGVDIHRCRQGEPSITLAQVTPYHIRYGSLLPRNLEGIMVIGRCIDGSHLALASYRLIADCMAMGEAAAIAAKDIVSKAIGTRDVDVSALRQTMKERGYQL